MVAARNFSEWYAFFGGEEMGLPRDKVVAVWEAATKVAEARFTSTNKRRNAICRWKHDAEESTYLTSCDKTWYFPEGTAQDNGVVYCHNCGKRASFR